jgi:hypothetical protein
MPADAGRLRGAAAALTLLSGAVMMLAGYVGDTSCWRNAAFITVPGGIVILAAFALARRAELAEGGAVAPSGVVTDGGAAGTGGGRFGRPAVLAVILLSGGVMVLAGYAASAWSWVAAPALAALGGLVILAAFAIDRRGP